MREIAVDLATVPRHTLEPQSQGAYFFTGPVEEIGRPLSAETDAAYPEVIGIEFTPGCSSVAGAGLGGLIGLVMGGALTLDLLGESPISLVGSLVLAIIGGYIGWFVGRKAGLVLSGGPPSESLSLVGTEGGMISRRTAGDVHVSIFRWSQVYAIRFNVVFLYKGPFDDTETPRPGLRIHNQQYDKDCVGSRWKCQVLSHDGDEIVPKKLLARHNLAGALLASHGEHVLAKARSEVASGRPFGFPVYRSELSRFKKNTDRQGEIVVSANGLQWAEDDREPVLANFEDLTFFCEERGKLQIKSKSNTDYSVEMSRVGNLLSLIVLVEELRTGSSYPGIGMRLGREMVANKT